jgi:hypothetical protein
MNYMRVLRQVALCLSGAISLATVHVGVLQAQRIESRDFGRRDPPAEMSRMTINPKILEGVNAGENTYWIEGLAIGTVVGALVLYNRGVVGVESITPRVVLGLTVFGGLVGGVPGALIGGQFKKSPPAETAEAP